MRSHPRRTLLAAGLAVAAVLASACGDDSTTATTSTTEATVTTAPPTSASPTTTAPDDGAIEVMVAGGAVAGGAEVEEVTVGESVTLKVTSDVADHVHVHGYDLFVDLEPGVAGSISFAADIPGIFEVEFERTATFAFELEVG